MVAMMKKTFFSAMTLTVLLMLAACEVVPATLEIGLNPGIDTVDVNTVFEDAGAWATYGDVPIDVIVVTDDVDITALGTYKVVYEATYGGETVEATRIVTVIDALEPELTLNPGIDTVVVGQPWTDAGVTVTDNSGLEVQVTVTGDVDIMTPGTYTVTYTATDQSGNEATVTRGVFVIEGA
jgi:hypothetical protein